MGKGDKRTVKGKIAKGSHGKTRPRKKKTLIPTIKKTDKISEPQKAKTIKKEVAEPVKATAKKATTKKSTAKKETTKKTTTKKKTDEPSKKDAED